MPPSKSTRAKTERPAVRKTPTKPAPKKPALIAVQSKERYHNGMIPGATNWKPNEVREVTAPILAQLRADFPNNWQAVRNA